MRAVRLSTAVGPHVGRFKGVWQASESEFWGQKPVKTHEERLRNARERLRRFTPHSNIIGPTTWVPWTTLDSSTTSAVLFPRLRGHASQGALEGFFGPFDALHASEWNVIHPVTQKSLLSPRGPQSSVARHRHRPWV